MDIPLYYIECGFLSSLFTWADYKKPEKYNAPISFIISKNGFYFDATKPNSIETALNDNNIIINSKQKTRAKKCIKYLLDNKLTKYNSQPIYTPNIGRYGKRKILLVDQSFGDYSITKGLASNYTFAEMLDTAVKENKDADIIIKTHPDTIAGRACYYKDIAEHDNIFLQTDPINPISLLNYIDEVYTCTSQLGFEALLCGKKVHVFGMPFYAGWGLTDDRIKLQRRNNKRSLEEIFYIVYIMNSLYVNPKVKSRCEIEEAMEYLCSQRKEYFRKHLS